MRCRTFALGALTFVALAALSATIVHAQPAQKSPAVLRTVFVGLGDDSGVRSWSPPQTRPRSPSEVDSWVTAVINPTARDSKNNDALLQTGAGGFIDVTVVNLEALLHWNNLQPSTTKARTSEADLVLFLDDQEVKGLHPRRATAGDMRSRVILLRGEKVRVTERILHFEFDRAPANKAWPLGVGFDEPELWDASPRTVGVGFPGGTSIRSQSLDPNDPENTHVMVDLVPRWHATDKVPEYALTLDSWVGAFAFNDRDVTDRQFTYGLGDDITLSLYNADAYIQWAQHKDRSKVSERTIGNLVLFIDGRPIPDLHPTVPREPSEDLARGARAGRMIVPLHRLQFTLRRTSESNDVWAALLNRPTLYRNVSVSVGFSDLAPVISNIGTQFESMRLKVIPINTWSISGAVLIVASLVLFFLLAAKSDLIRDARLSSKPDGLKPFSLAKTQMAFWFFLVFSTYFFIFVITGDKDTIPAGILGLIGVSAATAVGSALVDAAGRSDVPATQVHPSIPISNRREEIRRLEQEEVNARTALGGLAGDQLATKQKELEDIQYARRYLRRSRWQNFVYDLFAEDGVVSFHSFQICVWTLTLGIIFMKEVWDKLAMPEFSATLVGLMGISSGTYVALKDKPSNKP